MSRLTPRNGATSMESKPPANPRAGLINLGNTCYMNCALQALSMTPDFTRQLMLLDCSSKTIRQMQRLIALLHFASVPKSVMLATSNAMFPIGSQHDSSEYLGYLLSMLHSKEKVMGLLLGPEDRRKPANWTETLERIAPFTNQISIADRSFAGQMTNVYRCLICLYESHIPSSFRELQLSFPETGKKNFSVQTLLDVNAMSQILDGVNKYACVHCAKHSKGEHLVKLTEGPRNIILTIKRFSYNRETQQPTKLMNQIYHNDMITLNQYDKETLQHTVTLHYRLYAVIVHVGYSLDSGHYYILARDQDNKWLKFDDSVVTYARRGDVYNLRGPRAAHVLIYRLAGKSIIRPDGEPSAMVPIAPVRQLKLEELPAKIRNYVNRIMDGTENNN